MVIKKQIQYALYCWTIVILSCQLVLGSVCVGDDYEIQQVDDSEGSVSDPKVALLFMIQDSFAQPEIWQAWLQDATHWSASTVHRDAFSTYVHATAEHTYGVPHLLKHSMISHVQGQWGALDMIMLALINAALEDPSNAFFIFISDSTVPLKPFSIIYSDLESNPRSRFAFSAGVLTKLGGLKHSQWSVLTRRHALALSRNAPLWRCAKWTKTVDPQAGKGVGVAAPDEYLPFETLVHVFGTEGALRGVNSGNTDVLTAQQEADVFEHTFVDWQPWKSNAIGNYTHDHLPAVWRDVAADRLWKLTNVPQLWFFRKVLPSTVVTNAKPYDTVPLYDALASFSCMDANADRWANK